MCTALGVDPQWGSPTIVCNAPLEGMIERDISTAPRPCSVASHLAGAPRVQRARSGPAPRHPRHAGRPQEEDGGVWVEHVPRAAAEALPGPWPMPVVAGCSIYRVPDTHPEQQKKPFWKLCQLLQLSTRQAVRLPVMSVSGIMLQGKPATLSSPTPPFPSSLSSPPHLRVPPHSCSPGRRLTISFSSSSWRAQQ